MSVYCTCVKPEPDEVENGIVVCLACMNEIERHEDAPEPDFSDAPDLIDSGRLSLDYEQSLGNSHNE